MVFFEKIQDDVKAVIGKGLFHADIRPEWGSENENHRLEIRKAILQFLKDHFPQEVEDSIWDLDTPPVFKNLKVSISHCKGTGGFVISTRSVGLDMEEKERISNAVVERVALAEELRSATDWKLLWPAKEAVFKCDSQYVMITQINVQFEAASQNEIYKFRTINAQGWAYSDSQHVFALAIKN